MKQIILGNGQVSKAIKPYINAETLETYDKGEWENIKRTQCDVIHICIPYSKEFINTVNEARKVFSPELIVVHSTVKVGTCKELKCSYSPVMGRHDSDFSQDVNRYNKTFAGCEFEWLLFRKAVKFSVEYYGNNTNELEFSKIMSTSYMFWNLIYEKTVHNLCDERGYDFDKVYTRWNENYNLGMEKTNKDWMRPIYKHNEDPIPGGHCLVPNTELDDNFITGICREWVKRKGNLKLVSIE